MVNYFNLKAAITHSSPREKPNNRRFRRINVKFHRIFAFFLKTNCVIKSLNV